MTDSQNSIIWMIWDSAAEWVVRRLLAEGELPNLSYINKKGLYASAIPPSPNCQTPPSLATLFTGQWPKNHNVTGFLIPDKSRGMTKVISGFDRSVIRAELLWELLDRNNKKICFSHIPWVRNTNKFTSVSPNYTFFIDGFQNQKAKSEVIEIQNLNNFYSITVDTFKFELSIYSDHIIVQEMKSNFEETFKITSDISWRECWFDQLGIRFTVWKRHDGRIFFIHMGLWKVYASSHIPKELQMFHGEGLGRAYRNGLFGKRLIDGGDGKAEQVFMESIRLLSEYFTSCSTYVFDSFLNQDLYMFYQPCIDDVQHELLGWCDPSNPAYNHEIASKAWVFIKEAYRFADNQLGEILKRKSDNHTVIISSDHGMSGISKIVFINEILRQAGLLQINENGSIDEDETYVYYHPANNGSVWLNNNIPPIKRDEIIRNTIQILENIDGNKVIERILPRDMINDDEYDETMGDLFLSAVDGYDFSADIDGSGDIIKPSLKSASHSTNTTRSKLQGIFIARGPFLSDYGDLGTIDNRLLFPFICEQLEVQAPDYCMNLSDGLRKKSNVNDQIKINYSKN